jgi:hypothetical protein
MFRLLGPYFKAVRKLKERTPYMLWSRKEELVHAALRYASEEVDQEMM